jgi:FAD/FMN-containing dehydrogenase
MANLTIASRNGSTTTLDESTINGFKAGFRGSLIAPEDPQYEAARSIWNAMIERRPALIARCTGTADVIRAVKFAKDHDLRVSVRSGGHNIAGNALCDGGWVIDLSQLKGIRVDPKRKTATAGPGVTLGDFDHETQAFGLATPLGINSTTGIAGLTLGGGFGWLSRRYGLTVDNLLSADVVTADGELVTASEKKEPDLFWGVRGGGGNLGIVTSFEYRLHKLGPEVLAGLIVYRLADAEAVIRNYREFVAQAPEELTCWIVLRKAPPLPFLPPAIHGKEVIVLAFLYAAGVRKGKQVIKPLREFRAPVGEMVMPLPYVGWQQAFDPLLTPGARNYWKSHNFRELSDGAVKVMLDYAGRFPSPDSEIFVAHLGGAVNRVPVDATAYPHRDAIFVMNVHTRWDSPGQDGSCASWARAFFDATAPFATGGVYVNFISEGEDRVRAAYGANYQRLAQLKRRYDPANMFSSNQNVKPA